MNYNEQEYRPFVISGGDQFPPKSVKTSSMVVVPEDFMEKTREVIPFQGYVEKSEHLDLPSDLRGP